MTKPQLNLQDVFLNQVRKESTNVTIYLVNSVQLRGLVRGFDAFTVLLDSPGRPTQLVYKHAITSIVPSRPVSGFLPESRREPMASPRTAPATTDAEPAQEPPTPE